MLIAVQNQLVPWIIKTQKHWDYRWLRDVCISAPTGSGKTLSYVLPIIQVGRAHQNQNYFSMVKQLCLLFF